MFELGSPMGNFVVMAVIVIVAVLVVYMLFPLLMRKFGGGTVEQNMALLDKIVSTAGEVAQMLDKNPKTESPVELILRLAKVGVHSAEQLYEMGLLGKDERLKSVKCFVERSIAEYGIELSENQKAITEAVIEGFVNMLPKTHTESKDK